MKKENKIIVSLIVLFSLITVFYCVYLVINRDLKISDAIKFRNEFMNLNDKINLDNDKQYLNVSISNTNTVKYTTEDEIINILEKGNGLIFLGDATSSWCRSIVSTLTEIAEQEKETIYYFDISNIRSLFELDNDKISKVKDGTKGYYKILKLLEDYLEDFYITDELGNHYNTGEKRLNVPTLIMVRKGSITGFHQGTIGTQESSYDKLTGEEGEKLKEIIKNLIVSKHLKEVCTIEKC